MSDMSISMCENVGVPSVSTIVSASAASAARSENASRPASSARASGTSVSGSLNGIRAACSVSSRSASLSTPSTESPWSAKVIASGSPTRPSPITATSWVITLRLAVAQMAPVLAREAQDEAGVVAQVAPPQPARLVDQPERPLQPHALQRVGRLGDETGMEVERGAHADEHGCVQPFPHASHPLLLLRHADADPHDIRAGAVDLADHGVLLG